jgi:hypothetical protein
MTKIEVTEELRQAVIEAVAGALGGCAYDCTRVWSAWSYGTMSQDDFSLVAGDDSRLAEIDADGEVLLYGLSNNSSSFEPQDDYEAICGCTTTEYFNTVFNEWEEL